MTTAQGAGKVISLTHRPHLPQEILLELIFVRGWVDPRVRVRSEGLFQGKIPMKKSGIEPATFRFVVQHLNHCATAVPLYTIWQSRSQWPRRLRRRSVAARLLRLWVRIPPGAWMFVCCDCCVLSGRGLCDELITRPEESNRLSCVVVCDLETSWMRMPWPTRRLLCQKKGKENMT